MCYFCYLKWILLCFPVPSQILTYQGRPLKAHVDFWNYQRGAIISASFMFHSFLMSYNFLLLYCNPLVARNSFLNGCCKNSGSFFADFSLTNLESLSATFLPYSLLPGTHSTLCSHPEALRCVHALWLPWIDLVLCKWGLFPSTLIPVVLLEIII